MLGVVRVTTFYAWKAKVNVAEVNLLVVRGHAGITILPLFTQPTPKANLPDEDMKALTERTQDGGTEVVEAKVGKDAATFSMAYPGAILAYACLKGLNDVPDVVECSFVQSSSLSYLSLHPRSCDLLKQPRRTLKGGDGVVEVLWKKEVEKFPICLGAFDDVGLATCAHGLSRECLLANWRSLTPGFCPISIMMVIKQEHELVLTPIQNYFRMNVEQNWMELSKVSALLHELEILRMVTKEANKFAEKIELLEFKFPI
ncbi:hypothetical protein ACH5RR_016060 [Cinchona calisaya]|uniref:Lactate/malate dehydrogenase C-terminal domain-containing protein n=1 Tax=Cinchona calisaya TaxID=153742 RepID=A0ABD2ZWV6_9GENT